MKLKLAHFNSLISLADHFSSEKRCRDFITRQRWGATVICPFCGGRHIYRCSNGDNQFKCASCRRRFSCLVGTIFQKTKLPLKKWFMAMYLISSHKKTSNKLVSLKRREWDSNPRALSDKRFSRPPRYDHFDTSANMKLLSRPSAT